MENNSILIEAEEIVNGARATDYGSAIKSFNKVALIANSMLDSQEIELLESTGELNATVVCKIMMAVKLTRQSHNHKRDNLVDLCGYAELLNRLEEV